MTYIPDDLLVLIWKSYFKYIVLHEFEKNTNTLIETFEFDDLEMELVFKKPIHLNCNLLKEHTIEHEKHPVFRIIYYDNRSCDNSSKIKYYFRYSSAGISIHWLNVSYKQLVRKVNIH